MEQTMTGIVAQKSPVQAGAAAATAADVMRPPLTTVAPHDHAAAAAYLVKHAGTTALIVVDAQAGHPVGIITEADIARAVADGKDVNDVWVNAVMTIRPAVTPTTTIRDTAELMTTRHFRHLPVADDTGLLGLADITDVCRALLAAEQGSPHDPRRSRLPTEVTGPDCDTLARRDAAAVSHVQPVKQDA